MIERHKNAFVKKTLLYEKQRVNTSNNIIHATCRTHTEGERAKVIFNPPLTTPGS